MMTGHRSPFVRRSDRRRSNLRYAAGRFRILSFAILDIIDSLTGRSARCCPDTARTGAVCTGVRLDGGAFIRLQKMPPSAAS